MEKMESEVGSTPRKRGKTRRGRATGLLSDRTKHNSTLHFVSYELRSDQINDWIQNKLRSLQFLKNINRSPTFLKLKFKAIKIGVMNISSTLIIKTLLISFKHIFTIRIPTLNLVKRKKIFNILFKMNGSCFF